MVRRADARTLSDAAALADRLWPGHADGELLEEFLDALNTGETAFFLKYQGDDVPVGFAQCQLRHDYVEGTSGSPVGYLEGVYVEEPFRRRGYARELLCACEEWARSKGCREFASDCTIDNHDSFLFHTGAGFMEAGRIICFTKKL